VPKRSAQCAHLAKAVEVAAIAGIGQQGKQGAAPGSGQAHHAGQSIGAIEALFAPSIPQPFSDANSIEIGELNQAADIVGRHAVD